MPESTADALFFDVLETLDQYYAARDPLKGALAKGFVNVAEARKTMGTQLNQHNYDLRMKATSLVCIEPPPLVPSPASTVVPDDLLQRTISITRITPATSTSSASSLLNVMSSSSSLDPSPALRRRTVVTSNEENTAPSASESRATGDSAPSDTTATSGLETPGDSGADGKEKVEDDNPDKSPPQPSPKPQRPPRDPLKWFGVLVPLALREAQGDFTRALSYAVAVAELKLELRRRIKEYESVVEIASAAEKKDANEVEDIRAEKQEAKVEESIETET
ncbi:hypothetical protein HDU93_007552 [Gonapodya sp. JEL0774]|nr:hypothetical protein HDU93_007552 [Gonapodya sp. JEL0774]